MHVYSMESSLEVNWGGAGLELVNSVIHTLKCKYYDLLEFN